MPFSDNDAASKNFMPRISLRNQRNVTLNCTLRNLQNVLTLHMFAVSVKIVIDVTKPEVPFIINEGQSKSRK
jgi:hypothetical protein